MTSDTPQDSSSVPGPTPTPTPTFNSSAAAAAADDEHNLHQLLEARTLSFFSAVNSRQYDTRVPPWTFTDSVHFSVATTFHRQPLKSTEAIAAAWKQYTDEYPFYHMDVTEVSSATTPSRPCGFVEVYVKFTQNEGSGRDGIFKDAICKAVWVWKCEVRDWRVQFADSFVGVDCTAP